MKEGVAQHVGMNAVKEEEQVESGGLRSHSGGSTEDQNEDSPKQQKPRSGPEFLGLSRCAACYNQKERSMPHWGDDGESSSSAEDSGPEADWESDAESSSSSSSSGGGGGGGGGGGSEKALSEILEKPSPVCGDAAEAGEKHGDRQEETSEVEEDTNRTMTWRAPLVKSLSLPTSLTPHLSPLSLLPRPHTVVSSLHLQVLTPKHDNSSSCFLELSGKDEREKSDGGRREEISGVRPPQPFPWQQTGLPWLQGSQPTLHQHQLSYQQQPHQEQQPPHFPPLSARGQRLPPPPHALPVPHPATLHTPQHLHAPTPLPCWYCYSMHPPHTYHTQ